MGRLRLILLAGVAALAIGAVVSIGASATEPEQWYVSGAALGEGNTSEVLEKATTVKTAELEIPGLSLLVKCTGLKAKKTFIKGLAEMTAEALVFTGCTANSNCTVTSEISTKPLVASVKDVAGTKEIEIKWEPVTPTTFATITFSGAKCLLTGTQPIKGTMKTIASTGQTESVIQELVTNSSGELKVGTNPADLKSTLKDELVSKKAWAFH